jgi:hypothetical protein
MLNGIKYLFPPFPPFYPSFYAPRTWPTPSATPMAFSPPTKYASSPACPKLRLLTPRAPSRTLSACGTATALVHSFRPGPPLLMAERDFSRSLPMSVADDLWSWRWSGCTHTKKNTHREHTENTMEKKTKSEYTPMLDTPMQEVPHTHTTHTQHTHNTHTTHTQHTHNTHTHTHKQYKVEPVSFLLPQQHSSGGTAHANS